MSKHSRFASNEMASLTVQAGLSTRPVPMEPYRSPEYYQLEIDRVFKRAWLMMCRVEELPEPNSYVVKEIECCNVSVLITRQKNGEIKSFHNVCAHRGNQVALDDQGTASRFVCRYHSWTFANDGRLLGVPDEASFFSLDKSKCGLTPIATEVWEGFVFINLSPVPEVSLTEFLGEFGEYMKGVHYIAADHPIVVAGELQCNWKVVSDAFSEAYHIPAIHPHTLGSTFASKSDPFAHLLGARLFGPHQSSMQPRNVEYMPRETSHVELLGQSLSPTSTAISTADASVMEKYLDHPAVRPKNVPTWGIGINNIFPNSQIDFGLGGFFTHYFWPLSYNRTRYEGRFYMVRPTNAIQRFRMEEHIARISEIMLEDLNNVERTQKGLESRAKDFMHLQDNEIAIRHGIDTIEKWVRSETVRDALA